MIKEQTPLKWPGNWPRTLPEKQQERSSWKKTQSFYLGMLDVELKRMGTVSSVVTMQPKGARDPGVAVWFSRIRKEDFSWRDTLEITAAYPTVDDVDSAYRRLAAQYHTDKDSEGLELFLKIGKARAAAKEWVNRQEGVTHDMSIACDTFQETRLNVAALWQSIKHIRGLERCGTSALMEKTFEGFAQITEKSSVVSV